MTHRQWQLSCILLTNKCHHPWAQEQRLWSSIASSVIWTAVTVIINWAAYFRQNKCHPWAQEQQLQATFETQATSHWTASHKPLHTRNFPPHATRPQPTNDSLPQQRHNHRLHPNISCRNRLPWFNLECVLLHLRRLVFSWIATLLNKTAHVLT